MADFDFDQWFSGFWSLYDAKLCGGETQKGSRDEAYLIALELVTTEELGKRVFAGLGAQKTYIQDCMRHCQPYKRLPSASKWLKRKMWGNEIPSHTAMKDKAKAEAGSSICKCGKPGIINTFEKTREHDARSDRQVGSECLTCHNKAYQPHDWRYLMCRDKYKEMMDLSKQGGKNWEEQREIAKKFINRIRSKLDGN